jgi:hypothetical protein
VEIDEEGFDDFGRRIKKTTRVDRQAKEEAALKRLQEKYKHLTATANGEATLTAQSGTDTLPTRNTLYDKEIDRGRPKKDSSLTTVKRADSRDRNRNQGHSNNISYRQENLDRDQNKHRERERERDSRDRGNHYAGHNYNSTQSTQQRDRPRDNCRDKDRKSNRSRSHSRERRR